MAEEEEASSSPEELRYVLPQNSIVLDNSIVPWEQATLNPSRLIRNMTNNLKTHRYQEEENEKYVKKDIILLASAWCCLCKNDSVEFVCSVMPLIETNDKIQKRFNSVVKSQGLYWSNKNNDLIESCNALVSGYHINNSNLDREKKSVRDFLQEGEKFCNSIKKLLPKFDGKLVLDVPRCQSDIWVENQPQSQHQHNQSGIRNILHSILIRVMNIRTHYSQDEYVTGCNKILALYPIQVATNKTEENGVPDLAAVLYQIFTTSKGSSLFCNMAEVLYNTSSEYEILCGCAAAMRLDDNAHGGRADMFSQLIPIILCEIVEDKIIPKTHRPFFSTNKLRRLENQLGIGMHSKANYACNECGVSGSRCNDTNDTNGNEIIETGITLRKCNGCKRVWYCGRSCQEKNWSKHKHVCGTQYWRKTILYFQSEQQYENTKAVIKNNGTGVSMQINTTTLEPYVFCIDHNTNELFDGLTDRPVSCISPLPASSSPEDTSETDEAVNILRNQSKSKKDRNLTIADLPIDTTSTNTNIDNIDDIFCQVCSSDDITDNNNPIVLCDACNLGFHKYCYSIQVDDVDLDDKPWFCNPCCKNRSNASTSTSFFV